MKLQKILSYYFSDQSINDIFRRGILKSEYSKSLYDKLLDHSIDQTFERTDSHLSFDVYDGKKALTIQFKL